MKKTVKILAIAVIVIILSLLLAACGGGDGETTTTTTTTKKPDDKPSNPDDKKQYTVTEVVELLNGLTEEIGGRLLSDGGYNSIIPFESFSMDNFVYTGDSEYKYESFYRDGGYTHSVVTAPVNGQQIATTAISQIYSDYEAFIETINGSTVADVYPIYASGIDASFLTDEQLAALVIKEEDLTYSTSTPNLFVLSDDYLVDFLNVYAGTKVYNSLDVEGAVMNVDLTSYENTGILAVNVFPPEEMGSGNMSIIIDLTEFSDGKGKLKIDVTVEEISVNISLEKGESNSEKFKLVITDNYEEDAHVMELKTEYKGDGHKVADASDYFACNTIIYETRESYGETDVAYMKIAVAKIDGKIRGTMDIISGDDSSIPGGIAPMSSSLSGAKVKGTLDVTLDDDKKIKTFDASFELLFNGIDGEAQLTYNSAYLKENGKSPLEISVSTLADSLSLSLKTVSYSDGQGSYKLEYIEGENSVTSDVAIPAVKNHTLTEREQLLLDRADAHLAESQTTANNIANLMESTQSYIEQSIELGRDVTSFVTCMENNKYCYYTHVYSVDDMIYYDVEPILDCELYSFVYSRNSGGTNRVVIIDSEAMAFMKEYSKKLFNVSIYNYQIVSGMSTFMVGMEVEKLGLYIYFESTMGFDNSSRWVLSESPLSQEDFYLPLHMVDAELVNLSPENIHDLEKQLDRNCRVDYKCTKCNNLFTKNEVEHDYEETTLWEADGHRAGCTVEECTRCYRKNLIYSDESGNEIVFNLFNICDGARIEYSVNSIDRYSGPNEAYGALIVIPYEIGEDQYITQIDGFCFVGEGYDSFTAEMELQAGVKTIKEIPYFVETLYLNEGVKEMYSYAFHPTDSLIKTINIKFIGENINLGFIMPNSLTTINYIGTQEQFENLDIILGENVTANYNVSFE